MPWTISYTFQKLNISLKYFHQFKIMPNIQQAVYLKRHLLLLSFKTKNNSYQNTKTVLTQCLLKSGFENNLPANNWTLYDNKIFRANIQSSWFINNFPSECQSLHMLIYNNHKLCQFLATWIKPRYTDRTVPNEIVYTRNVTSTPR